MARASSALVNPAMLWIQITPSAAMVDTKRHIKYLSLSLQSGESFCCQPIYLFIFSKSESVIFKQKVSPVYAGTSALSHTVFHACLLYPADIDECSEYGTCPQACKNTKGSYDCDCALGYRKVGTGNQCEAEGTIEIVRNHRQ